MSLVEAVDTAVAYVRSHPDQMSRAEVEQLHRLADEVYVLAHHAGLHHALPQVAELSPELETQDVPLPPVQFVTKLNLPGDWDAVAAETAEPPALSWQDDSLDLPLPKRVFLPCASPRWYEDMGILRALAVAGQAKGKKDTDPTREAPPLAPSGTNRQVEAARPADDHETERRRKVMLALACLLTIGPNATRIAREVGVPRGTLLGWQAFRERYEQMKADIELRKRSRRRGRHANDRDFEADEE
jgi:hypothetical protein